MLSLIFETMETSTRPNQAKIEARKQTIRTYTLSRNNKLVSRFSFLYNEKRKRYDDVLEQLEAEFFISQARIVKILKNPLI